MQRLLDKKFIINFLKTHHKYVLASALGIVLFVSFILVFQPKNKSQELLEKQQGLSTVDEVLLPKFESVLEEISYVEDAIELNYTFVPTNGGYEFSMMLGGLQQLPEDRVLQDVFVELLFPKLLEVSSADIHISAGKLFPSDDLVMETVGFGPTAKSKIPFAITDLDIQKGAPMQELLSLFVETSSQIESIVLRDARVQSGSFVLNFDDQIIDNIHNNQ